MRSERISTSIIKKLITFILSVTILAIEVALIYFMMFEADKFKYYKYFVYAIRIWGLICVARIYSKDMNSSYKLTWTILILIFSFAGTLMYLLFGNGRSMPNYKAKKVFEHISKDIPKTTVLSDIKETSPSAYRIAYGLYKDTTMPLYTNTDITFLNDGLKKYKSLIEELNKATKYIYFEFFIIASGKYLNDIIEILEKKSLENVEIKILYDAIGSRKVLKRKDIQRLKNINNVRISAYEPLGLNINPAVNYRDHRKLIIIDGNTSYIGGDNLADEYIHEIERFGFWRDNGLMISGPATNSLLVLFAETWYMSTKETIDLPSHTGNYLSNNKGLILPFGDGPLKHYSPGYNLFKTLFGISRKSIYISTPYFIIDKDFISYLSLASKSGIDVRIIVPGTPDKKSVYMMSKAHFGSLLRNGVKIYKYNGFNHAKNIIIDNKYAYVGTTNIDYRSFFLHFELGAVIMHDDEVTKMQDDFLEAINNSSEYTYEMWKKRNIFEKQIAVLLNLLSPLL